MPDYTYSDSVPDANISADVVKSDFDESQIIAASNEENPHATPANQTSTIFLTPDQSQTTIDSDVAINERQKQIDLVKNLYGVSGPDSTLSQSQTQLQEGKNSVSTSSQQATNLY